MNCVEQMQSSSSSDIEVRTQQHSFNWGIIGFDKLTKPTFHFDQDKIVRSSESWETIESECFRAGKGYDNPDKWRLILNPFKVIEKEDYAAIYLQKVSGNPSRVQFKMHLLDDCNVKQRTQHGLHEFKTNSFFGWDNFVSRKDLYDVKQHLLMDGTLRVCCEMTIYHSIQISTGEVKNIERNQISISTEFYSLFYKLYLNKLYWDVVLKTEDKEFFVHKAVLSENSPVFKEMFAKAWEENCDICVEISDVSAPVLEQMIEFMYCRKITDLPEKLIGLYKCADKYKMPNLKKICRERLAKNVDADFIFETFIEAHLNDDKNLFDAVKEVLYSLPIKVYPSQLVEIYPDLAQGITKDNVTTSERKRLVVIKGENNNEKASKEASSCESDDN